MPSDSNPTRHSSMSPKEMKPNPTNLGTSNQVLRCRSAIGGGLAERCKKEATEGGLYSPSTTGLSSELGTGVKPRTERARIYNVGTHGLANPGLVGLNFDPILPSLNYLAPLSAPPRPLMQACRPVPISEELPV